MNHYQHIDPSMRQFLEELVKHPAPPLSELTLEQARSTLQNAQEPPAKLAGISVHGQVIPVGAFRQLKVEIPLTPFIVLWDGIVSMLRITHPSRCRPGRGPGST
jgi:hypothetical protein